MDSLDLSSLQYKQKYLKFSNFGIMNLFSENTRFHSMTLNITLPSEAQNIEGHPPVTTFDLARVGVRQSWSAGTVFI